jgi:hypothetical protein
MTSTSVGGRKSLDIPSASNPLPLSTAGFAKICLTLPDKCIAMAEAG